MTDMSEFWKSRRVLVTGHTGFKGSWLLMLLHHLGADIYGYALEPETNPSFFSSWTFKKDAELVKYLSGYYDNSFNHYTNAGSHQRKQTNKFVEITIKRNSVNRILSEWKRYKIVARKFNPISYVNYD